MSEEGLALEQERRRQEEMEAEREQYDRLIVCEQAGHMVEGDSCPCGKVTVDIAGREHGRWA